MKYKNREIFEIVTFAVILILYWGILYFVPHIYIFKNPQVIYIKRNVNVFFAIICFILFLINFYFIVNCCVKKFKKQDGLSDKQKSIKRKKGKQRKLSVILFVVIYFLFTNIIIIESQLNMCFSRYELSRYKIVKYNFFNRITEQYDLNEFSDILLIPTVYSGKGGKTSNILVKLNGPIYITFKEGQNLKLRLIFFKDLKDNFSNLRIEKKDIKYFKNSVFNEGNLSENERLFNEVFDYNFIR